MVLKIHIYNIYTLTKSVFCKTKLIREDGCLSRMNQCINELKIIITLVASVNSAVSVLLTTHVDDIALVPYNGFSLHIEV